MQTSWVLLTITSTARPATDLGFLLHKHPGRAQNFDESVGRVHVFYPEADEDRCTAALLLEVDPIELVRGKRFGAGDAMSLAQYVNDRPYAASSMLAVALGRVFKTAMAGRCDARPELVTQRLPLEVRLRSLPCRGGPEVAEQLFAPLGWRVNATPVPLDPTVPEWGDSRYVDLRLTGEHLLSDALSHLYVLLPKVPGPAPPAGGADRAARGRGIARSRYGLWLGCHGARASGRPCVRGGRRG